MVYLPSAAMATVLVLNGIELSLTVTVPIIGAPAAAVPLMVDAPAAGVVLLPPPATVDSEQDGC